MQGILGHLMGHWLALLVVLVLLELVASRRAVLWLALGTLPHALSSLVMVRQVHQVMASVVTLVMTGTPHSMG